MDALILVVDSFNGEIRMTRKRTQVAPTTTDPVPQNTSGKKWAEPYRPLQTDASAGFELGENKLANLLVFSFAKDPGDGAKTSLKKYGYLYDTRQKTWTVNATAVTREIAKRLAGEFASEKSITR
jgi:hypothetical protein